MATTLVVLLLTQIDKVLLSKLLTLESFGYYALAWTVAAALSMLLAPITTAVYPRMVALVSTGDERAQAGLYHLSAQLVTVALVPAALVLSVHAQGILFAWSGDPQLAAHTAPLLSVLAVGTLLNSMMHMPYNLQLAHGWTGLALRMNLVAVALLVPAIFWLVPQHGAIAAAWIWAALNASYVVVGAPLMFRRLLPGAQRSWYLQDMALPTAGVLAALALTYALRPVGYADRWHWLYFLALCSLGSLAAATILAPHVRRTLQSWRGRPVAP